MRARLLLNVGLLVVAVVIGLVLVLGSDEKPAPQALTLTPLSANQVTRLRIERPGHEPVEMVKGEQGWQLQTPPALPANAFRVHSIARAAQAVSHAHYDVAAADLARFGLDHPRAKLYLDDYELDFGDTEPISGRRYVLTGNTVHLTDDAFLHQLATPPASFVDPNPLGPDARPVEIRLPGHHLTLSAGRWKLDPQRPNVSADAVTALVDAWRHAQALSVRTLASAPTNAASVTVRLAGNPDPIRFEVVQDKQEVVLARTDVGVAYHFTPATGARLLTLKQEEKAPKSGGAETTED